MPGDFSDEDMGVMFEFLRDLREGDLYLEIGVQFGRSLQFAKNYTLTFRIDYRV